MNNNTNVQNLKGVPALLKKIKENLETIFTKDQTILDAVNSDQYDELLKETETLVKQVTTDLKKHPADAGAEELELVKKIQKNVTNLGENIHEITTNISDSKREKLVMDCYKDIENALALISSTND